MGVNGLVRSPMYLWVSSPFILNAQIKACPIGAKTNVLSWTPQFKYPCLKQKVSGNSLSANHWFFLIWAMGSQEKGFKYCQAQGQTWNIKSKLDPEIGSVMGWPTTTNRQLFSSWKLLVVKLRSKFRSGPRSGPEVPGLNLNVRLGQFDLLPYIHLISPDIHLTFTWPSTDHHLTLSWP